MDGLPWERRGSASSLAQQAQVCWPSRLDCWVLEMDSPCVWLSPEGHSVRHRAIVNEVPEGQMLLLFIQFLMMGCDAIPRKEELSWDSQRTDVQFPTSKGAVRSKEMLEMSHCLVGVVWLMTGRTWVDV